MFFRSPRHLLEILTGTEDLVEFQVNGNSYTQAYYLADGIYPNWPVLIKTLRHATDPAGKLFSTLQEAARKDIERAFGVLQARWGMVSQPCRLWCLEEVAQMMICAIILHNMIVEERSEDDPYLKDLQTENTPQIKPSHRDPLIHHTLQSLHHNHMKLRSEVIHHRLMNDLKVHNWMAQGGLA